MKRLARLVQSFSLPEMPVKYGIIEEWQTRIQVQQDGDHLKQNWKERSDSTNVDFVRNCDFIDFRSLQIRAAGISLYNLIRLLSGYPSYLAIFGLLIYLFFSSGLRKQEDSYLAFSPYLLKALLILRPAWFGNMVWTSPF